MVRQTSEVVSRTSGNLQESLQVEKQRSSLPVTLLPCDWTSILSEFKKKYGTQIPDDRLPAQSMFEHFSEKLADGTLKAEPLSHVVSLFEEEQQDMKKPDPSRQYNLQLDSRLTDPSRQYNLQLDSRLTMTTKRRHLSSEPTDEKGVASEIRRHHQPLASGADASAREVIYQDFDLSLYVQ